MLSEPVQCVSRRAFFECVAAIVLASLTGCGIGETGAAQMIPPLGRIKDAAMNGALLVSGPVKFPQHGITLQGFFCRPPGAGPFPAILLLPSAAEPDDVIRQEAARLASQQYVVLVPDLLSRYSGCAAFASQAEARAAQVNISNEEVIADLRACCDYLKTHPAVQGQSIQVQSFTHSNAKLL